VTEAETVGSTSFADGLEYVGTVFIDNCNNRDLTASSTNADKSPLRPAPSKYRLTRRSTSADTVKVQRADCFMFPPDAQPTGFVALIVFSFLLYFQSVD
jgi:hypothetical protein